MDERRECGDVTFGLEMGFGFCFEVEEEEDATFLVRMLESPVRVIRGTDDDDAVEERDDDDDEEDEDEDEDEEDVPFPRF